MGFISWRFWRKEPEMRNTAQATCLSDSVIQGLPASVEILSLAQARCAFQALEEWLLSGQARQLPMHEVEREQEQLPFRSFSYELQRRMVKAAVQGPFSEAVERVEESTGVSAPKRSIEQVVEQAACEFEVFYQKRTPPPQEKTGPILVGSVDCKGVPMKKPQPAPKVVRRGKGQKANKKKMAVVAAVYT